MTDAKKISPDAVNLLMDKLQTRFEKNRQRHPDIKWDDVKSKLIQKEEKLNVLHEMELTGGEPDVVGYDESTHEFIFFDCSPESPAGRRSLCYDRKALDSRKENKPVNSALDMATTMGIELLTETQYRKLLQTGTFDAKTSSWVKTPEDIRDKGGAIFCDYRYGHVFVYHNGAESYYAARGFRGCLQV